MSENSLQVETGLSQGTTKTLEDLLNKIRAYFPQADLKIIEKAYLFSERAHEGQIRRSGEPYISHPLSVAGILADLHLDLDSIATGLLHDTVEDTHATLEDVRREFGEPIAQLVDGVTKISQMKFKNSNEKQGENVRKMIVAMGRDVRVLLVKLCDRLHNMRTMNFMPFEKQERIALETLEIYCPLAGRMGISSLKIELEDLCFRYFRPDMYYQLVQKVRKTEGERSRYIDDVKLQISHELQKANFKFDVFGRSKHLWSIYKKMQSRSIDYEQLYDVLAFRVIVDSVAECYGVLGLVHSLWKPIPGRFKDFIAMPKANNYQSLHTTVIGPGGERIEIQIRTREMHLVAERGIAAHWKYKERGKVDDDSEFQQANWLRDLVSSHQQVKSADEFLDSVKTDLFESEIYVFTPKGDVREFPEGASPLDFAYAVHTQLGNQCVGARVNGKMVPLRYQLQNGDSIEIVTSKTQVPTKDWLKLVVTNKAKQKIRQYVKEEQRRRSLTLGKDLVEKEFRKFGMAAAKQLKGPEFELFLKENGLRDIDELYVKVGYGRLEPRHLVNKVSPRSAEKEAAKTEEATFMEKVVKAAAQKTRKSNSLISVDGMDDVLVHFAKCCNPIPGDSISGFISRGRGITVHRADCPKAFEMDQLRKVDVAWTGAQAKEGQERMVRVRVVSHDVPGLLKSMSEVFSVQGINIESAQIRTTKDKKAICNFEVSVKDTTQLNNAIYELQKIKGILGVTRVLH
ncbi:MAG: bifunctional (p)ppGpp synthetase/guanosine-3',5'-bis(diphosphate) 3'-pyrophosphohydrolase [Bdellovibrionaceae bacterium]|nr:bifunctional (p)ppGpp synthetase/guanosine-3',5'-bis(diphosphate) 3'-pyrophosphohydrolase [Pseudobdellovibrionaceae bacterium]